MSGRTILRVGYLAGFVLALGSVLPAQPPPAYGPPGNAPAPVPAIFGLDDLTHIAMEQNPRLAQATFVIETARGQATQAGLYPNPTVSVTFDELFDRQGPAGIITAPQITQEIVVCGKLRLSQAAAMKGIDQATLDLMARRYALLGEIRVAYFDAVGLQQRITLLRQLVQLADASVVTAEKLVKAGEAAPLAVVQLQVEQERVRADLDAAERELPGTYRRLAAVVVNGLPIHGVAGDLARPVPYYDLDKVQHHVLAYHPEVHAAQVAIDRAQFELKRQEVEPIPNVTLTAGYVRQNQNKSNDAMIGFSLPVPLWNKNQGNIAAAQGRLGEAIYRVGQVENDLADRVAQAHRDLSAARLRAERYRTVILPRAQESYQLSRKAFGLTREQDLGLEYLRVVEAQGALTQAALEYVRAAQDGWRAAAVLSGLALEEHWPPPPPAKPATATEPETLPLPRKEAEKVNGRDPQPEEIPLPRRQP